MYYKRIFVIFTLILSLGFLFSSAAAQENATGNFEIWPVFIDPPDGSVDILVSPDENTVIRSAFRSCSRPLSRAWIFADVVSLSLDGDPLVSTRRESWSHWSKPMPVPNDEEVPCVNGSDTLWLVIWEYDLGILPPGYYQVHFKEHVKYPFTDGADYDGDGYRDFFNWDVNVDFNISVAEVGSISGWVTDDSGNPVAGIWVDSCEESVSEDEWGSSILCNGAHTDESGFYTITALQPGNYRVVIWGDEVYLPQFFDHKFNYDEADMIPVVSGQTTEYTNFDIILGGTISGMVYETNGGAPIAGVHVDACSMDDTFCNGAETNELGEYTITGLLPDKTYRVFVWGQSGWSNEIYEETIWWDQATLIPIGATNINFTLEPGGSISGVVTDIDGVPLANIGVDIMDGGYGACTDENGHYVIMGLPFGTYDLVAGRDFCGPHPYIEQVTPGVTIDADNPDLSGTNFELSAGGSITGNVTADGGGLIAENIDVSACFADNSFCRWASVQSDGTYAITGLLAGDYRVHAYPWPEGYWIGEVFDDSQDWEVYTPVTVVSGAEIADIDFELTLGGAITGVVEDGAGNAIEGLWVVAHDDAGDYFVNWAQTGPDGRYRILGLPAGTYRVFINPQNGWTEQEYAPSPVTVVAGVDTFDIDFTLAPDSTISGIVTDALGYHIPERIDVAACLVENIDICWWTTVQEDDSYTIVGLSAGAYLINVYEVPGGNWIGDTYPTTILLGEDEDVTGIDFVLEAFGE